MDLTSMEIFGAATAVAQSPPRVAVIKDHDASWLSPHDAMSTGGPYGATATQECVFDSPAGATLDMIVTWPAAELPDARVRVPFRAI